MGSKGNTWCKRCERNQRCKYAIPVDALQKKVVQLSYGEKPTIIADSD